MNIGSLSRRLSVLHYDLADTARVLEGFTRAVHTARAEQHQAARAPRPERDRKTA